MRQNSVIPGAAMSEANGDGLGAPWPSGTMRAAVLQAVGRVVLSWVPIPEPQPGTALVRVRYTGLCGTDLELLHGHTGYQHDGRTRFPHVPGHEWTGAVVAVADEAVDLSPGDRVVGQTMVPCDACSTCRAGRRRDCPDLVETGLYGLPGAAAEYIRVPARALVALPDAVDDLAVPLIEPAVTAVEALERAALRHGKSVAVVGTGTMGLLTVQLAAGIAGRIDAYGIDPAGLELACRLGATETVLSDGSPPLRRYQLVVEASGTAPGFHTAMSLAARGSRVAVVGVTPGPMPAFDPAQLVLRGIDLLGIRHGLDYYQRTIDLLAAGELRTEPLIGAVFPVARIAEAYEHLAGGRGGAPKILVSLDPDEMEMP